MNLKIFVISLVSSLMYVALAAWPYGGLGPFLAHPARVALMWVMVGGFVAACFTRSSGLGSGQREDRGNRWVFVPITILSLGAAVLPSWCDAHDVWVIDGDVARYSGVVLAAVGMVLRLWPVFVLGRRFSGLVAIQTNHTLETGSIYRTIRHPSYLGLLMGLIGWALVFRSLAGLVLAAAMLWPLVGRMDAEEKLLSEHFGQEYEAYRRRTWRLIPNLY